MLFGREPVGQSGYLLRRQYHDITRSLFQPTRITLDLALMAANTGCVCPFPLLIECRRVDLDMIDIEHSDGQAGCLC